MGAALGLALVALSGCESAGHEKADTTAANMDTLRGDLAKLKEKSTAAYSAASNLIDKADSDPKPAFAAFQAEVKNYESARAAVVDHQKTMKSNTNDFFASWEKQTASITDPDVKQKSIERRAKLQKSIETVDKAMEGVIAETTPYSATLKNLEVYWSNDLTSGGITMMKDKVGDAKKASKSIGEKCDDVTSAIDKAAPDFKTAKPPPPAPAKEGDKDKDKK
jgi:hypothetical protein